MRGIVVGLGSMGKRRLRLIKGFFEGIELCGVDSRAERRAEAAGLFGIDSYDSISEAAEAFLPEIAFVCTSPLSHNAIITELLERGISIFTEINLVDDGYEENTGLAQQKGLTLFLSSTPIYRKEIEYIEDTAKNYDGLLAYQYHVGQYLPDWHPWENYKDFFAGDKHTNGCREIFAIELPWMTRAFGKIKNIHAVKNQMTKLSIDYPDAYLVTLEHESGVIGQMAVDVVSRKAVRELKIIGEQLYLTWKGTPDSLSIYDFDSKSDAFIDTYETVNRDSRYADNIIENAYVDELAAFFAVLDGKPARRHSFADDAEILEIIDKIEG